MTERSKTRTWWCGNCRNRYFEPHGTDFCDAAKRIADTVTLHAVAGSAGRFVAFRLDDGRNVGSVYDSHADAVRDMRWDRDRFIYIKVAPDGMQPKEAAEFLDYARKLHDKGFRLPAPDDRIEADFSMPLLRQDRARQTKYLTSRS